MRQVAVAVPLCTAAVLAACASDRPVAEPDAEQHSFEPSLYLPRSHSHNDYARPKPLFDALERGFASVEVDVFLMDGELLVAHERDEVSPSVTLRGLYLDPLRTIVRRNGGSVYSRSDRPLQLLIDVKSEAEQTYQALHETLGDYSDILTSWTEDEVKPGPVRAVLSGNRAIRFAEDEPVRFLALDGRVEDGRSTMTADAMPLVSVDWERLEPRKAADRLAAARALVEQLHGEGRKVRFWGTPEREEFWRSLVAIGVDYIGTDNPSRLQRLLRDVGGPASSMVED